MSRNYNKMNKDMFLKDLSEKPWGLINDSTPLDVAVDLLTNFITESLDKHAPLRKRPFRRKQKSNFSPDLQTLQSLRDRAKKDMIQSDGTIDISIFQNYKRLRNKCTTRARAEKRLEISESLETDQSQANIWRVVKSVSNQSQAKQIIPPPSPPYQQMTWTNILQQKSSVYKKKMILPLQWISIKSFVLKWPAETWNLLFALFRNEQSKNHKKDETKIFSWPGWYQPPNSKTMRWCDCVPSHTYIKLFAPNWKVSDTLETTTHCSGIQKG